MIAGRRKELVGLGIGRVVRPGGFVDVPPTGPPFINCWFGDDDIPLSLVLLSSMIVCGRGRPGIAA